MVPWPVPGNHASVQVFSKPIAIDGSANVTGTCAANGTNWATMVITSGDSVLEINETLSNDESSSAIALTVRLDPANFPGAARGMLAFLVQLRSNSGVLSLYD